MTPSDRSPCPYDWCTTTHGDTAHPDDEDHRNDGTQLTAILRADDGTVHEAEIEFGMLRRRADSETWFIVDQGSSRRLEIALDSARRLLRAIVDSHTLRSVIW